MWDDVFRHIPGFLMMRLSQDIFRKLWLGFCLYVMWRVGSAPLLLVELSRISVNFSLHGLFHRHSRALSIICGKIGSTAKLGILQFWCGFCAIISSTVVVFSFAIIWLTTRIIWGHLHHISCSFLHQKVLIIEVRMVVMTRYIFLSLHFDWDYHILLVLKGFPRVYVIPIAPVHWNFLSRLSLIQILLSLLLFTRI